MELRTVSFACVLALIGVTEANKFHCKTSEDDKHYVKPLCYVDHCGKSIKAQIAEELKAAFAYLSMAIHFDQDSVNRPGLANFLYEAASEERHHAIMMLEYLNLRGFNYDHVFNKTFPVDSGVKYRDAIKVSLDMEIGVTNLIYSIVEECTSDFHAADVFTDPILAEQHDGIRKLQGFLKTYDDMMLGKENNPAEMAFAEYMFDKKLQA